MSTSTPQESVSADYMANTQDEIAPPHEQQPSTSITTLELPRPTTPAVEPTSTPVSPLALSPPSKPTRSKPVDSSKKTATIKQEEPKKMCPRCGKSEWYGHCAICGYPGRMDLM